MRRSTHSMSLDNLSSHLCCRGCWSRQVFVFHLWQLLNPPVDCPSQRIFQWFCLKVENTWAPNDLSKSVGTFMSDLTEVPAVWSVTVLRLCFYLTDIMVHHQLSVTTLLRYNGCIQTQQWIGWPREATWEALNHFSAVQIKRRFFGKSLVA